MKRETREILRKTIKEQMAALLDMEHSLRLTRNHTNLEYFGDVVNTLISKEGSKYLLHSLDPIAMDYQLSILTKVQAEKEINEYLLILSKKELREEIEYNQELIDFSEEDVYVLPQEYHKNK